jgi:hypothetical protein
MRILFKLFLILLLMTGLSREVMAQYSRSYLPFTPAKNNVIKRFDTLRVGHCYDLDNSTTIGVVFRYWMLDMCAGVFKNNKNSETIAAFDTVNVSDTTRFYFYRTTNPSDGVVIIWESRYIFDSELRAYLFKNGKVVKMGKIDVDLDDALLTQVSYPVSKISITTDGRRVQFNFKAPLKFRISQPFSPGDFYYLYEGGNQLIPIKNGKPGKPLW